MRKNRSHNRKSRTLRALLLLTLLCGGALADSNLRLVSTEYTLSFPALPPGFDGLRIVQLSDLHGAVFGKNNRRLIGAVRSARPDLIALTGDLTERYSDLHQVDLLLAELVKTAPVYYVSGNHEWQSKTLTPLRELFARRGVVYLRNEAVTLVRNGDSIVLAGVEDPNGWADQPKPDQVAAALPAGSFRVLLGHRNYWAEEYPALPVDLILCGHAHGGVIRLPGVGGLLDHHGGLLPRYEAGVYACGRWRMVVSRGLGNTGGLLRLFNNPEIVTIVLRRAEAGRRGEGEAE